MDPINLLLLVGAGLAAGFIAGLIGVGGGIIFAPVLFFYYQSIGVSEAIIAPLTIGSSLLCTLIAAVVSAWAQYGRNAVITSIAVRVGIFSALAIYLMTRFVTTQPWYDGTVFQVVFSVVLLIVVIRMVVPSGEKEPHISGNRTRTYSWPALAGTGTTAGAVAAAAGVGGGVVLVPAYNNVLGLPILSSTATSSATIVIISLVGVINYAWMGWGEPVPPSAIGYVDALRAGLLAVPAILTANLGVSVAHKINRRTLRRSFAIIAAVVAVRLLWGAIG